MDALPFDAPSPSDCLGCAAMPARMFMEFWDITPKVVRLLILVKYPCQFLYLMTGIFN
jgi:hypothetical protein